MSVLLQHPIWQIVRTCEVFVEDAVYTNQENISFCVTGSISTIFENCMHKWSTYLDSLTSNFFQRVSSRAISPLQPASKLWPSGNVCAFSDSESYGDIHPFPATMYIAEFFSSLTDDSSCRPL